jgi:hypothetical protein
MERWLFPSELGVLWFLPMELAAITITHKVSAWRRRYRM